MPQLPGVHWQTCASILVLGSSLFSSLAAGQETSTKLDHVTATAQIGKVEVEISFERKVPSARISHLTNPERLVFDFVGATTTPGLQRQEVGQDYVKAVRTASFGQDEQGRPVARVVIDLFGTVSFETKSQKDKLIIDVFKGPPDAVAETPVRKTVPTVPPVAGKIKRPITLTEPTRSVPTSGVIAVQTVDIRDDSIVLTFSGEVRPQRTELDNPPRLVVDFPGVLSGPSLKKRIPDVPGVQVRQVRTSQFQTNPAIYRVVLDQIGRESTSAITSARNQVVIRYVRSSTVPVASTLTRETAPAADPVAVQPEPSRPSAAPRVPPSSDRGNWDVRFENGLLTVQAKNANMADLLYAVAEKTGAAIEMPFSEGIFDRVTLTMGPAKPRDVISTILESSSFHYYIVENTQGGLEKVMLIPK